jgi:hypothetical protein
MVEEHSVNKEQERNEGIRNNVTETFLSVT